MDAIKSLSEVEPFKRLPAAVVAELEAAATTRAFPPQSYIFRQHDPPTGFLYVIQSGLIEIVALAPGGVEMVVDYRREGGFFGGTPFLTNEPYTAGARSVSGTTCYLIPDRLVADITRNYPQLNEYFTRTILTRVRSLYREMIGEHTRGALNQLEVFPFRKRLSEFMKTDVVTCAADTPAHLLAGLMQQSEIGAILVAVDDDPVGGIITEHDLVSKLLIRQTETWQAVTAREVMTPNPLTMRPDTYMYEATALMVRHKIKHLPVVEANRVVGLVTLLDLMKTRSQNTMLLVGGIREAESLEELAQCKAEIVKIAKAFLSEARSPLEAQELLSFLHQRILRRGFELVVQEMLQSGMKQPEVRFCFFLLGSGGREEMLLDPDQDSGIVFEDYPDALDREVESFFIPLAKKLVTAFATIGYPPCKGGVMPTNQLWRGRLKDWEKRLDGWINVPEPQRIRYSNNFFDFSPLVGEPELCRELRTIVQQKIMAFPMFLYQLMELNFAHKVPLGLMGGFVLEKEGKHQGKVPTKQTGSLFIVDCLRIFSLEQQLEATNTIERLEQLVRRKVFSPETAEHLKAAFQAFVFLRLRQEIDLIERGLAPTHYLDPDCLSKNEQDLLKEAYRAASKLQDSTRRHFSRLVG